MWSTRPAPPAADFLASPPPDTRPVDPAAVANRSAFKVGGAGPGGNAQPAADPGEGVLEHFGLAGVAGVLRAGDAPATLCGDLGAGLPSVQLDVLVPGSADALVQLDQTVLVQLPELVQLGLADQVRFRLGQ